MGCFNKVGFISHLPITEGDDIVLFICADLFGFHTDETPISPGSMSPLFLPIKGKYDDYGGITDVTHDNNVTYIESLFGLPIERIIDVIQRDGGIPLKQMEIERSDDSTAQFKELNDDYRNMLKLLTENIQFYSIDSKKLYLTTTMEHLSVYHKIAESYVSDDFSKAYEESLLMLKELDCITKVNPFDMHRSSLTMRTELNTLSQQLQKGEELDKELLKKISESSLTQLKLDRILLNVDIRNPFRETWVGMKGYNCLGFDWDANKDDVFKCVSFVRGMRLLGLCFYPSTYGNQAIDEELREIKNLYSHFLEIIDKKIEKYFVD